MLRNVVRGAFFEPSGKFPVEQCLFFIAHTRVGIPEQMIRLGIFLLQAGSTCEVVYGFRPKLLLHEYTSPVVDGFEGTRWEGNGLIEVAQSVIQLAGVGQSDSSTHPGDEQTRTEVEKAKSQLRNGEDNVKEVIVFLSSTVIGLKSNCISFLILIINPSGISETSFIYKTDKNPLLFIFLQKIYHSCVFFPLKAKILFVFPNNSLVHGVNYLIHGVN